MYRDRTDIGNTHCTHAPRLVVNIFFRSDDLAELDTVLDRASRVFRESGFAVQTLAFEDASARSLEADTNVVIVRGVNEESLATRHDALVALLDAEPVVIAAVPDPCGATLNELADREDVRRWQLTPTNRERMPTRLVAHVCAMVVHGDDAEPCDGPEPELAGYIAERLERDGELAPPWVEHPEFPRYGTGWMAADGEAHLLALSEWVGGLTHDRRMAYVKRHAPVPVSWVGWVAAVLFPYEDHWNTDKAVELVEVEGLADYAAWTRWLAGDWG